MGAESPVSPEEPIARRSHDGGERRGFPEGPLISSFPARGGQIWVTSGMRKWQAGLA
jgi:hypothetical protein